MELERKLKLMESTNQKFSDEIYFRKEDEKNYSEGQEFKRQKIEEKLQEQQNYSKEMGFTLGMDGSKQNVARAQTQFSNLLVDMETQFGEENDQ